MNQTEHWLEMCDQYRDFLLKNHRRPSKYKSEEHELLNWMKHNRKLINKGEFLPERMEKYEQLKKLADTYRRVNQHQYANGEKTNQDKPQIRNYAPNMIQKRK